MVLKLNLLILFKVTQLICRIQRHMKISDQHTVNLYRDEQNNNII